MSTYSPLETAFEKQTKTIKDHGEKQINAIKNKKERQINLFNNDEGN